MDKLLTFVLVEGLRELVDCWGDLEALEKDPLLSLNANVLGPLHEASQVLLGLDVTSDSEVAGGLLEQGVLGARAGSGGTGADDHLLAFNSFLHLYT